MATEVHSSTLLLASRRGVPRKKLSLTRPPIPPCWKKPPFPPKTGRVRHGVAEDAVHPYAFASKIHIVPKKLIDPVHVAVGK